MSDEEKLAEAPAEAVKDESVNLDAPAPAEEVKDEPKVEGEPEVAGEEEAGDEGKPKKPSGAQRAKAREARLLNELAERDRRIEELSRKPAQDAGTEGEKPPKEEDFNGDWFSYREAKMAYESRQAIRDELRKDRETRETSERSAKQAETARQRATDHAERVEEARETITDFDEVMEDMKGVNVRNDVIDEIMSSDKSALLAYHLAKNPDKLQALNELTPRELAREIGRLEGSIRMPAAKKQTTAPKPLTPLKGGAAGSFDPEAASMEEYAAKRKAGWKG